MTFGVGPKNFLGRSKADRPWYRRVLRRGRAVVLSLFIALTGGPLAEAAGDGKKVSANEIYAELEQISNGLEQIRYIMGRPKPLTSMVQARNVSYRECYFQARMMMKKADQLCFDQLRRRFPIPKRPEHVPDIQDLNKMVEGTFKRVRSLRADLGRTDDIKAPNVEGMKTPSDLFELILKNDQQLDQLTNNTLSASDTYQLVTEAMGATARMLETFSEGKPVPETPKFLDGQQPHDVVKVLSDCLVLVKSIADRSEVEMMDLTMGKIEPENVRPADTHDLAALLMAELEFLRKKCPKAGPALPAYYPGRKFPSHVHQQSRALKVQLQQLDDLVKKNPKWLANEPAKP